MIKSGIENCFLILCSTFYFDSSQIIVPTLTSFLMDSCKVASALFLVKIFSCIFYTDERNSHSDFYLFTFFCIEREPCTDIVACNIFIILCVQLVFALVFIPFCFYTLHGTLFLPVSCSFRSFVDAHHKIDREYSLRVVTESPEHFHAFYFTIADSTHESTCFVS